MERQAVQQPQRGGRALISNRKRSQLLEANLGGGGASRLHCGPLPFEDC